MPYSVLQILKNQQHLIQDALQDSLLSKNDQNDIFFSPQHYSFLLHCLQLKQDQSLATEILHNLFSSLANSHCHDHIEGGFFDGSLKKSLNSNAIYLSLFSDFSGYFFDGFFSIPAIQSAQWLINNLQAEDGVFYQCMGTENDNVLSDYYTIKPEEVKKCLDHDSRIAFISAYNLSQQEPVHQIKLSQVRSFQQIADDTNLHIKQVPLALENALQLLSLSQKNKKSPAIDYSISLKDNCRAIISLFKAARQFNQDNFSKSALAAIESLYHLFLKHKITDCADYLLLIQALLARLQYQWCDVSFQWLEKLACQFIKSPVANTETIIQTMVHEQLISPINDFYILEVLIDKIDFQAKAASISKELKGMVLDNTTIQPALLTTYLQTLIQSHLIIITGKAYEAGYWSQQISSGFNPSNNIYVIADNIAVPHHLRFPPTNKTIANIYPLGSVKSSHHKAKQTEDSLENLLDNYSSSKKRYPEGYLL
ncbi:MAG: hypothetical protein GY808_18045 [Gammaproteobacteria bacterium]|nr:hypothetical protein [Gammaproteobacteria bacterium]